MKEVEYKIISNREIARNVFRMELDGDTEAIRTPGQFVELRLPGHYLRRPISVCDWSKDRLLLIYKVVGQGTEDMSYLERGSYLSALTGLGNGYDSSAVPDRPVLAGGGVGVPPLYALCKRLVQENKHPYVALGFNSREDVFYEGEFRALGVCAREGWAVQLRGKDGLRLRRLHGLQHGDPERGEAGLQGGTGF